MATHLKIGIVGCGQAARIHLGRLRTLEGVEVVALADPDLEAARALSKDVGGAVPSFSDHQELLSQVRPDALAIFTPHRAHYRPALDALQAGCHVFVEKPLSTNPQEAVDIINVARARELVVAIGHQYRLRPSLREARRLLAAGAIGPVRLVVATLSQPWLAAHSGPEESWRLDPRVSGGGIVCDSGDHLLDALLWTTGQTPAEAYAVQERLSGGPDVVTAAVVRLGAGLPATVAISGVSPGNLFELVYHGESGRLRATEEALWGQSGGEPEQALALPEAASPSIDADFVDAIRARTAPTCSADDALPTVRLLEAITRSAATGQPVRLAGPSPSGRPTS